MRVYTRIVVDIATGGIISRETFNYHGPVSLAISAGASGSGSKSKSKSQSKSESESGVKYNEDFLNRIFGQEGQPGVFGYEPAANAQFVTPNYTGGAYTGGAYTPGKFTAVAPEGFGRLEESLYGGALSKLSQAYSQNVARQREELSQAGALNSPAQYLEGSARSSMDRSYLESLQQAARDAATQRIGLESSEAARRTGFDVGEGQARTAYDVGQGAARTAYDVGQGQQRTAFDVGEAGRATTFNQKQVDDLWNRFMQKIAYALEASKYARGEATSYGTSSAVSGGGGISGSFGGGS